MAFIGDKSEKRRPLKSGLLALWYTGESYAGNVPGETLMRMNRLVGDAALGVPNEPIMCRHTL